MAQHVQRYTACCATWRRTLFDLDQHHLSFVDLALREHLVKMAAAPFGFSVGDLFAGIKLLTDIADALKTTSTASADF